MVVVLFEAELASSWLLVVAVVAGTEVGHFLTVLAFIHFITTR